MQLGLAALLLAALAAPVRGWRPVAGAATVATRRIGAGARSGRWSALRAEEGEEAEVLREVEEVVPPPEPPQLVDLGEPATSAEVADFLLKLAKSVDKDTKATIKEAVAEATATVAEEKEIIYISEGNGGVADDEIGTVAHVTPAQAHQQIKELGNAVLLDVRHPEEFVHGHAAGAQNIPFSILGTSGMEARPDFAYEVCRKMPSDGEPAQELAMLMSLCPPISPLGDVHVPHRHADLRDLPGRPPFGARD
mmetsp:Transcript_36440/g.114229  ORF Transcript_36440/g.114229 Transcript_36440/m.114229 type:complete len:251 (-) Transcript_36440:312-1064(-)